MEDLLKGANLKYSESQSPRQTETPGGIMARTGHEFLTHRNLA